MASASIKKVQAKLFRGEDSPKSQPLDAKGSAGPGLKPLNIHIPKPGSQPQGPNPPPKLNKQVPDDTSEPVDDEPTKLWRARLAEKLGSDYNGAERYRLDQDVKKERHWKRWGPYLAERQWVC